MTLRDNLAVHPVGAWDSGSFRGAICQLAEEFSGRAQTGFICHIGALQLAHRVNTVRLTMPTSFPVLQHRNSLHPAMAHQRGESVDRGLIHDGNDRFGHHIACLPMAGCQEQLSYYRISGDR